MSEYEYDYEDLGLVAGLEIHQQLDTATKLFCGCPTELREPDDAARTFTRFLHPTKSELGELDEAALEESRVEREFEYLAYDTTCLVEEDDEPPHGLDHEARTVAMQIAELLDMNVVDQAHVMRKLVIDGSNTSGFQRSSLIAQEGELQTSDGPVSVVDLMLEEESAQRIEERDDGVLFSLDRLGIPLVEIGTGPDISSPEQAREAAETIGMLLRSTGKVKRGLGTIRQDVNVSIADGARVEIKGVQALDQIDEIVRFEVGRQAELVEIRDELQSRDASVGDVTDVTDVFEDSDSGVIKGALDSGGKVMGVPLYGFDGLVGRELQPDRRLGTEFSDHAKRHGAGGIFHTDELPAYGVTEDEVDALREAVGAGPEDAVAIVADDPETADLSIEAVAERAEVAIEEVPEETRGANDDGTTRYLRPLPGAARMYPETDVIPVDLDPSDVETPELLTEKVDRYQDEFGLDAGLAEQVAYGRKCRCSSRRSTRVSTRRSPRASSNRRLRNSAVTTLPSRNSPTRTYSPSCTSSKTATSPKRASTTCSRPSPRTPTSPPKKRSKKRVSPASPRTKSARQSRKSSTETPSRSKNRVWARSPRSWAKRWAHSAARPTAAS